jgi:chaperonin cofactor prefoldin
MEKRNRRLDKALESSETRCGALEASNVALQETVESLKAELAETRRGAGTTESGLRSEVEAVSFL